MQEENFNKLPEECSNKELDRLVNFQLAQIDGDDISRPNIFVIFNIPYSVNIVNFTENKDLLPFSVTLNSGFGELKVPAPRAAIIEMSKRFQNYLNG